jgi:hypothetical protein
MSDVDLDKLVDDVDAQHASSPDGMQAKISHTLHTSNVPVPTVADAPGKPKEPWYTRMAHNAFLPGNMKEVTAPFKDWTSYLPPDPISTGIRGS